MVELLQRRDALAPFETFHLAGHWDEDGRQMGEAIRRVVMRYLWNVPVRMSNERLTAVLGRYHIPAAQAPTGAMSNYSTRELARIIRTMPGVEDGLIA